MIMSNACPNRSRFQRSRRSRRFRRRSVKSSAYAFPGSNPGSATQKPRSALGEPRAYLSSGTVRQTVGSRSCMLFRQVSGPRALRIPTSRPLPFTRQPHSRVARCRAFPRVGPGSANCDRADLESADAVNAVSLAVMAIAVLVVTAQREPYAP